MIGEFERAVRRAAVVGKVRRIYRRRNLTRALPGWWLR